MKTIVTTWVGFLLLVRVVHAESTTSDQLRISLSRVPAVELPIAAAALIKQANSANRARITTNVVTQAIELNPAAAPLIVGAVVRTVPESAPLTVRIAAGLQPGQVEEITRAAVGAAPNRAGQIVAAVCGAAPAEYKSVALVAARLAPQTSRDILNAVGASRPDLKPYLEEEVLACRNSRPAVGYCLEQAERARDRANSAKRGGGNGPPDHAPPPDKPPRGNGRPPGGRNYARP